MCIRDRCKAHGIEIARNLIGPYITSLEMAGMSITLLKADDEILKFWDAPVMAMEPSRAYTCLLYTSRCV